MTRTHTQDSAAPAAQAFLWARPPTEPADLDPPLSLAEVTAELVRIADAEGPAAATAERAAAGLGPAGASVGHYVRRPADVLDLLIDAVFGEAGAQVASGGDWRAEVREAALSLRAAVQRHPWSARLVYRRPLFGPQAMRHLDLAMAAFERSGLDITAAASYASRVTDLVLGAALTDQEEAEMQRQRAGTRSDHEWHQVVAPFLDGIAASGRYPAFSRFLTAGAPHPSSEESFALSLDALLDGLALRLPER